MFEIVPQEVLWSILGSHQTLWSLPLPNVTWHSRTWPYTKTPSIDQTLHLFANLLPNWTLIPILTLLPNFGDFHRTLQRVRLANRGRLLLRTPGPVPFGTCICSNVETILSWTCHVYGPFEFRTSLGTSILLLTLLLIWTLLLNLTFYLIARFFHRIFATDAACQQRTLTPPDTWSCPTLGLASVLMLWPISPELVLSPDFWVSNIPQYLCFA